MNQSDDVVLDFGEEEFDRERTLKYVIMITAVTFFFFFLSSNPGSAQASF